MCRFGRRAEASAPRAQVKHKRTFYWLEQLLIKHNITSRVHNIKARCGRGDMRTGLEANRATLRTADRSNLTASISTGPSAITPTLCWCVFERARALVGARKTCARCVSGVQNFLPQVVPVRKANVSKRLISADVHSNTANFKFSHFIEVMGLTRAGRWFPQRHRWCVTRPLGRLRRFAETTLCSSPASSAVSAAPC